MSISRISMLAFAAALFVAPVAADPVGTWRTENDRSLVRIAACGAGLCGTVVSLKEPNDPDTGKPKLDKFNADTSKRGRPLIGVAILLNAKPSGPNKWVGQVYNAEDGKTYDGTLTEVSPTSLKLEGCALAGFICRSQTWTRAN
jgi:uncharacterized protein (DUF2147 family)